SRPSAAPAEPLVVDPAVWQRLAPFVDQVLDLDAGERAAFLQRLAASEPELRRELDAFLASEAAARNFMERPLDARATALLRAMAQDERSWDASQLEGTTIGPYRVVRELGQGGMG